MTRLFNLKIVSLLFACAIYMLYLWCKQKGKKMETILKNTAFTLQFNGSKSYYVVDTTDTCIFSSSSKRKATNFFYKVSKCQGL